MPVEDELMLFDPESAEMGDLSAENGFTPETPEDGGQEKAPNDNELLAANENEKNNSAEKPEVDPWKEALIERVGGQPEDWQEDRRGDGYRLVGDQILNAEGKVWPGLDPEMFTQWKEGGDAFYRTEDYKEPIENGERIWETLIHFNKETGEVSYRIHFHDVEYPDREPTNDNQEHTEARAAQQAQWAEDAPEETVQAGELMLSFMQAEHQATLDESEPAEIISNEPFANEPALTISAERVETLANDPVVKALGAEEIKSDLEIPHVVLQEFLDVGRFDDESAVAESSTSQEFVEPIQRVPEPTIAPRAEIESDMSLPSIEPVIELAKVATRETIDDVKPIIESKADAEEIIADVLQEEPEIEPEMIDVEAITTEQVSIPITPEEGPAVELRNALPEVPKIEVQAEPIENKVEDMVLAELFKDELLGSPETYDDTVAESNVVQGSEQEEVVSEAITTLQIEKIGVPQEIRSEFLDVHPVVANDNAPSVPIVAERAPAVVKVIEVEASGDQRTAQTQPQMREVAAPKNLDIESASAPVQSVETTMPRSEDPHELEIIEGALQIMRGENIRTESLRDESLSPVASENERHTPSAGAEILSFPRGIPMSEFPHLQGGQGMFSAQRDTGTDTRRPREHVIKLKGITMRKAA